MDLCYYLAEHVLLDILIYLPVMSLLQFKAVCTYWRSLIESPAFISEHVAHNRDNNEEDDFIVLGRTWDRRPCESKFALLSGSQLEECVYDIDRGKFWFPVTGNTSIVGYCDGIVCLKLQGEIALWNPALKQVRRMSPPLLKENTLLYASFGADLKSNDYKMVRILITEEEINGRYCMVGNQVEVYNLRGDGSWRIIYKDDVLPFHVIFPCHAAFSRKSGMCFWLAIYNETTILLSFDFSDDVFRTMRLPDEGESTFDLHIDLLDDVVVCMVKKPNGDATFDLDVWMLHEFGVEESWNMIYKVGPFFCLDRILPRFLKNGEFLMCSKSYDDIGQNRFYLYNLHTQQGNFIQSCNLEPWIPGELTRYKASLVSLKKANFVKPTQ